MAFLKISIIIPVFNEVGIINQSLQHLYEIIKPHICEVIVVDGNPAGNTIQSISSNNIKKIISPKGRGAQMNAGAECASGDILLFLHADTLLPEKAIDHVLSACNNSDVIGGAFNLGIDSNRFIFRITERYVFIRSRMTKIPYGDQAIFLKKVIFERMGGFNNIPIMEDIDLMRRIKHCGYKIRFIPEQVKTSPRRWETDGVLYSTIRNIILSTLFYIGVSPRTLKKWYKFKKASE